MPHDIGYWICRKYAILEAVLNLSCDDLGWERKGPKNRPKHTRKRIHQAKKNFLEKFKTAS